MDSKRSSMYGSLKSLKKIWSNEFPSAIRCWNGMISTHFWKGWLRPITVAQTDAADGDVEHLEGLDGNRPLWFATTRRNVWFWSLLSATNATRVDQSKRCCFPPRQLHIFDNSKKTEESWLGSFDASTVQPRPCIIRLPFVSILSKLSWRS